MTQRLFQRIKFVARAEVDFNGVCKEATLVDISLRGALIAFQEVLNPTLGSPCHLTVYLSESEVQLPFEGMVVHSNGHLAGIKFTLISIDTMIHLRRLLELNTGDPEQVRSELDSFIEPS
ncbi:MAG TPA: PilZ domain-containing protein [Geobacteraceae bacterium]|jgi:hypothetical protein|nr:PilZ domain-containing protein [Geobacteraceae bacterium]